MANDAEKTFCKTLLILLITIGLSSPQLLIHEDSKTLRNLQPSVSQRRHYNNNQNNNYDYQQAVLTHYENEVQNPQPVQQQQQFQQVPMEYTTIQYSPQQQHQQSHPLLGSPNQIPHYPERKPEKVFVVSEVEAKFPIILQGPPSQQSHVVPRLPPPPTHLLPNYQTPGLKSVSQNETGTRPEGGNGFASELLRGYNNVDNFVGSSNQEDNTNSLVGNVQVQSSGGYARRPPPQPLIPNLNNQNAPDPVHPTFTKNFWLSNLEVPQVVLEELNIFPDSITLSGFSSGGSLAQQLLVSYPSLFSGIAVFQQTFYRCGRGNGDVLDFDNLCTNVGNQSNFTRPYDPNLAVTDINAYFHNGLIENPRNLQNKRLYVYAGLQNNIYSAEQMLTTIKIFEPLINNVLRIRARVQDATNLLPTNRFGYGCEESAIENHFLGNCNLNGPFEALNFLLGEDKIKLPDENVHPDLNSFLEFDQSEFFHGINEPHYMAKTGYLYVPDRCGPNSLQKCLFHIYFHGCRSGKDFNDGNHIRHSGFLELAELNNVIVLFPQIQRHERNMLGCWDSYGLTGPLYATQKGIQVMIIRRMLERILGPSNEITPLLTSSLSCDQITESNYHTCQGYN